MYIKNLTVNCKVFLCIFVSGLKALQNIEFHNAIISEIRDVTESIRRIFLRFPFELTYNSGQFVIIDFGELPHAFSSRSYSIADFSRGDTIELCVVLKKDGAATPLLFSKKPGDTLKTSLPQGRFILPAQADDVPNFGFICTGTGVAPFRAMIKELLLEKHYSGNIYLYFGCRHQNEILYRSEFEELSARFPNFRYTPVLSREAWEGARGYVHAHYPAVFESGPKALIYLCGWTEMLKETRDRLKSFGYTRNDIKIEYYD